MLYQNVYKILPPLARNDPEERSSQNVGNFFIRLAVDERLKDNTINRDQFLIILHKSNGKSS